MKPQDFLHEAANTYDYKHSIYGDNYRIIGKVMLNLFPNGLMLETEEDWNRIHLFLLTVVKITRYANNFTKDGHPDSVLDAIVYQAMLQEIDQEIMDADVAQILREGTKND